MPLEAEEIPEGLKLKLTDCGRRFLQDNRDEGDDWTRGTNYLFLDLLEGMIMNGWELIQPEECGALTNSFILSNEVERDDDGKILKLGKVYWYPDYAIRSEVDELYNNGECLLKSAE